MELPFVGMEEISPATTEDTKIEVKLSDNPALTSAQEALKAQLLERKQELEEGLREKRLCLKAATKRREDAGVQLYGMQKTLASLHIALNSTSNAFAARSEQHAKAKEELVEAQQLQKSRKIEMQALREKLEASQLELEDLAATLKQIENYNEKIKSEIAVNRRATYATEEMIIKAEKEKKEQDDLVGIQQERLKRQYERQAMLKAQLSAQKRETKVAYAALAEYGIEMESIKSEKKQISNHWKSSLIVLSRCDEALQALSDALTKQKEQELAVEGERHGYKKAIHLEQEKADIKTIMLKKIDGQKKLIQKEIEQIVMKRSVELEKYGKLLLSCEEIERSQATTKSEQEAVQNEILIAEKEILKHSQSISKLETEMLQGLSEHITLERSTQHLVEGMMELRQRIRSEEMTATELEYELARIRVDSVAVEDYVRSIKDTLNSLDGEVKQKNSYISKMQLETRRKNGEIEVKTKEIDRLNKQYDKLTANLVDKNVTPWENIIVNIRYEISIKAKVSGELQKQWLVLQTDLVCLTNENMNLMEKVQKMDSEKLTLIQRKKRLETDLCAVTKYSKDLDNSVRIKHSIITRLNEMIAKNSSMREYLASENLNLRSSHTLALKNLKEETLKLECQKEECNTEKLDVSREIVELQRHVVLWKRKITYEKKTQDALMEAIYSPSALLGSMKKEQGRLKLKLEDLTSRKERLVMDMETRVSSRQAIVIRVKAMSQKKAQDGPDSVEAVLLKGVTDLRRAVRECERAGKGVDERLETLDLKRELLASRIGEIDLEITMVLTEQEQVRLKLREANVSKSTKLMSTALYQHMVKKHQDVKANKWKLQTKVPLEAEILEFHKKCDILISLLQTFVKELPMLQFRLEVPLVQLQLVLAV